MKICFLSRQNSCRSQIAQAVLRHFDRTLEVVSAGIEPVDHVSPVAAEILSERGIDVPTSIPLHFDEVKNIEFDYLITICEGTLKEFKLPVVQYKRKIHLGINSPYKSFRSRDELREKCIKATNEIYRELDYFYQHIVCPTTGK